MSETRGAHSDGSTRKDKNGVTMKLVTFHMPIELFDELERRAAVEDRSTSKQVLHYLRAAMTSTIRTD